MPHRYAIDNDSQSYRYRPKTIDDAFGCHSREDIRLNNGCA